MLEWEMDEMEFSLSEIARRDERKACAEEVRKAGCLSNISSHLCWTKTGPHNGLPRQPASTIEEHNPCCPIALAAKLEAR